MNDAPAVVWFRQRARAIHPSAVGSSTAELVSTGVRLGADYPRPLVDQATARARALQGFATLTASPWFRG